MRRRVFVLGAGASAFARYPLAADLLRFLRVDPMPEKLTQDAAREVLGKLDTASRELLRTTRKNWDLETLLTHLDIYGTVGNMWLLVNDWTELDRLKIARVVAEQFQWHQYKLDAQVWDSGSRGLRACANPQDVRRVADAWAAFIQPQKSGKGPLLRSPPHAKWREKR